MSVLPTERRADLSRETKQNASQTLHVCCRILSQRGSVHIWVIMPFLFSGEYHSVLPRGGGGNCKFTELSQWQPGEKIGARPQKPHQAWGHFCS